MRHNLYLKEFFFFFYFPSPCVYTRDTTRAILSASVATCGFWIDEPAPNNSNEAKVSP